MRKVLIVISLIIFSSMNAFAELEQAASTETKIDSKKYNITNPSNKIMNDGFADIVVNLLPAVVNIATSQKIDSKTATSIDEMIQQLPEGSILDAFKELLEKQPLENREFSSLGSGFIISEDGYVVTNYHVIDKANKVTVTLNNTKSYQAKTIGIDKKTDLALLKIDATEKLPYVKMGNSDDNRIGQWVIAVGNPFGLGGSVSVGIISAQSRDITSGKFDNFIQTDAAINKGNSGGPLFNIKGEVIGIATAIFSPSGGNVGIGFATPTSTALPVIEQLKNKGEVVRGWLGVSIQDVSEEMAKAIGLNNKNGAFVAEVSKDGPAKKAGILATDIITKFDGVEIKEMKNLPTLVGKTAIGKEVEVEVLRQGKTKIFKAKIAKLSDEILEKAAKGDVDEEKNKTEESLLDMGLTNLTREVKEENKIRQSIKGILVADVKKDGIAAEKGIIKGDIILSANQIPLSSISDLKKIIKNLKKEGKDSILLFISRETLLQQKPITSAFILSLKESENKESKKNN